MSERFWIGQSVKIYLAKISHFTVHVCLIPVQWRGMKQWRRPHFLQSPYRHCSTMWSTELSDYIQMTNSPRDIPRPDQAIATSSYNNQIYFRQSKDWSITYIKRDIKHININIWQIQTTTPAYNNSFFVKTIPGWNKLPEKVTWVHRLRKHSVYIFNWAVCYLIVLQ